VERDERSWGVGDQDCVLFNIDVDLTGNQIFREVLGALVCSKGVHALNLLLGISTFNLTLVEADL